MNTKPSAMRLIRSFQNRIYELRGERVMLDRDLAVLFGIEPINLQLITLSNKTRFPEDFMFRLSKSEFSGLRNQIENLEKDNPLRLQNENSKEIESEESLPYAFTQLGVAMLCGLVNSDIAIAMNISLVRDLCQLEQSAQEQNGKGFGEIGKRTGQEAKLDKIYEALENLRDEKAARKKWEERDRIGFKNRP
jgi:hypothetical protein